MVIRGKLTITHASKNVKIGSKIGKIGNLAPKRERVLKNSQSQKRFLSVFNCFYLFFLRPHARAIKLNSNVGNLAPQGAGSKKIAKCQFAYPRQSFVNGSSTLPNFSLTGQVSKGKEVFGRE